MCIHPTKIDSSTEVACRFCWQCKRDRVNDLVGRCIAESRYSVKTYAITLTYDNDQGVNSAVLVYKDVQDFLKRVRKGFKVRYIVAGEYGSKKGRAHWHIILFFKDKDPQFALEQRVMWDKWPHGFVYVQKPDWGGFKYVLKYVLKDQDARSADNHLAMSKKPPLGYQFFDELAREHVEHGIIPRNYKYKIGGVRDDKGKERKFTMQGATRRNFFDEFYRLWKEKYGKDPSSDWLDNLGKGFVMSKKEKHYKPFVFGGLRKTSSESYVDYGRYLEGFYDTIPTIIHYRTFDDTVWIYSEGSSWWQVDEEEEALQEVLTQFRLTRLIYHDDLVEECQALEDKSKRIASNGLNYHEVFQEWH